MPEKKNLDDIKKMIVKMSPEKEDIEKLKSMESDLDKKDIKDIYVSLMEQNKTFPASYFVDKYLDNKLDKEDIKDIHKRLAESGIEVTGRTFLEDGKYYRVDKPEKASDVFLIHLKDNLGKKYADDIKLTYELEKIKNITDDKIISVDLNTNLPNIGGTDKNKINNR